MDDLALTVRWERRAERFVPVNELPECLPHGFRIEWSTNPERYRLVVSARGVWTDLRVDPELTLSVRQRNGPDFLGNNDRRSLGCSLFLILFLQRIQRIETAEHRLRI